MAWTVSSVRVRAPRIALFLALIAGSLASFPSPLTAQTVSPQIVEFDPSPDHNASVNGVAVVSRVRAALFRCRKHAAASRHRARQTEPRERRQDSFQLRGVAGRVAGGRRRVRSACRCGRSRRIVAEHHLEPVRVSRHDSPAACSYSLSTQSRSGNSASTTGTTVGVNAGSGCAWNASSDSAWLTITSGSSGSGAGSVGYSVAANSTTSQRVGRLTIAGATFTFTQAGAACGYSLSPTSRSVGTTDNDWKRRRDGWQRLRVDRHQLGQLADDHGQPERQRQRHRELQRGCQQRVDGPLGDADGWHRDVHADAERLVHLCRESNESRLQSLGWYRERHGDGRKRVLMDGHTIGILDHDYQRLERVGQRHRQLPCFGKWRFLVSNGDPDGRRTTRHDFAVRRHSSQLTGRSPHRVRAVVPATPASSVPCPGSGS